jgi:DNA-binding HxlR family transcriptional regulator
MNGRAKTKRKENRRGIETREKIMNLFCERQRPVVSMSVREIGREIGLLSTNSVNNELNVLQEMGRIRRRGVREIEVL